MYLNLRTLQEEDRRMFARFPARFPAKFKDSRDDFGSKVTLRDGSAQGFKVTSKERLFLNDNITLEVKVPDGLDPMVLKGQVVWARNDETDFWDVGLKLHEINLMRMSRLYKFFIGPT